MIKNKNKFRVCTYCVMDSSNPSIVFDESGRCNCCKDSIERMPFELFDNKIGKKKLLNLIGLLRKNGKNKKYDVLIGLSGGVDSAYLAHLIVTKFKLRPLAVHVDGGWNSSSAVSNIETIVRSLNIDLLTYVVEWNEMRDLQLSFLKSSVLNQDIPQDHLFFSVLYSTAIKYKINYFLSGVNFNSENISPPEWGHPYMDLTHIKAIHKEFGQIHLKTFPFMSLPKYIYLSRILKKLHVFKPLNYINYDKEKALSLLKFKYKWVDYGAKHHESRFTKFYQEIYLPKKFNFDKRRLHLSSLIVSSQITRSEAIKELEKPILAASEVKRDIRFISKKLGISSNELETLITSKPIHHSDYKNFISFHKFIFLMRKVLRIININI